MNSLLIIARHNAILATKRAGVPFCRMSLKALGSQSNRVAQRLFATIRVYDDRDYNDFDGHRLSEHLQGMLDMADRIEGSIKELKDTHTQSREAFGAGANPSETNALFGKAVLQKEEISNHIASLKTKMVDTRKVFAVDAPDGTSDFMRQAELKQVNQIIDFASTHKGIGKGIKHNKLDKKNRAHTQKVFEVDPPDEITDLENHVYLEEVDEIIDVASTHSDTNKLIKELEMDNQDKADAKRLSDLREADEIIDFASALHEDTDEILKQHEYQEAEQAEAHKTFAVDSPDGTPDDMVKRGHNRLRSFPRG